MDDNGQGKLSIRDVVGKRLGKSAGGTGGISDVQKTMRDINVVDETLNAAHKLAGTDKLQEEMQKAREERHRIMEENSGLKDQLTAAQIETLREGMNAQLEMMRQQMNSGDRKGVLETLQEFQQAQQLLGAGGGSRSALDELKTAYELLQQFQQPSKSLSEQLQEMFEVTNQIRGYAQPSAPAPGYDREIESTRLQIELQRSQQQFQIQLEMLKLEAEKGSREFDLRLEELREQRKSREAEIQSKIQAERERTQMIANGLEVLGGAVARATQEFQQGGRSMPFGGGNGSGGQVASQQKYEAAAAGGPRIGRKLQADMGESGSVECPECHTEMFLPPDSQRISCPGCQVQYPVERLAGEVPDLGGEASPSGDLE